jgi:hypothetical protein
VRGFSPRDIRGWILIGASGLLLVIVLIAANLYMLRRVGVGGEFLLPWKAARAFMFEQTEPYSSSVAAYVQGQVYGRPILSGEEAFLLDIPFHLLLLFFPLGLFRDPAVAGSIWLALSQAAFLGFLSLSIFLTDWQPKTMFQAAFYSLASVSFYVVFGFFENSPVYLLGLFYAGIVFSLRFELDELAGALIALSLAWWEIGLLFLILVVRRVVDERRWRVLAGFGMVTAILAVISLFIYPDWPWSHLRGVVSNWRVGYGFTPGDLFRSLFPEVGMYLGWGLTALLVVVLIVEWTAARGADFRHFYWTACLSLAVAPLTGFRGEFENLVILFLPLALVFSVVRERWKAGYWLVTLILLMVFLVPWGLFFGDVLTRPIRHAILYLFLPAITVTGLYWVRWWALRPPRTWLERAASMEYR